MVGHGFFNGCVFFDTTQQTMDVESINKEVEEIKSILFPPEEEKASDEVYQSFETRLAGILAAITAACESGEPGQRALGNNSVIRLITKVIDHKVTPPYLLQAALLAWMRLLRRETLVKASTVWENCDLSEEHIISLVPCMRQHVQDALVSFYGSSLVMMLASDSDSRQFRFGLIGTAKVMVAILSQHSQNIQLTEMTLRAIRNLSSLEQVATQLAAAQAGQALTALLLDASQPANVLEASLYAIINLSFDTENASVLGGDGVCQAIAALAQRADPALWQEVAWTVRNLTTVDQNTELFKDTSICDSILRILHGSDEPETLQTALWATANLCCERTLATKTLTLGVLDTFSRIFDMGLLSFPEDGRLGPVSEAIAFGVYNLSSVFSTQAEISSEAPDAEALATAEAGKQLLEQLVQTGGCQLVTAILQRYEGREAMVETCCRAIYLLAADCPQGKRLLTTLGTVESLCRAAWKHHAVPETAFLCWKSLLTICQANPDAVAVLQQQDSLLGEIARTIKEHAEIMEIVVLGCSILVLLPYFQNKLPTLLEGKFIDADHKINVNLADQDGMFAAWEIDAIIAAHPAVETVDSSSSVVV